MISIESQLEETVRFIRSRSQIKPKIAVVLGSGLGAFAHELKQVDMIPYQEIPYFTPPSVDGHGGRLFLGYIENVPIAVLQGRVHFYEGYSMSQVVYPVRTVAMLGIEILVLTNAAGGLNSQMQAGDFMILDDHINLMGDNPLKGPNLQSLGPRFPDMTEAYDQPINEKMATIFDQMGVRYSRGVYCGVSGPTYETPAEVKFLQIIGAQAVGMSTVPETIAANHLGVRVAAISCIANLATGMSPQKLTHDEVKATAARVEKDFCSFLTRLILEI